VLVFAFRHRKLGLRLGPGLSTTGHARFRRLVEFPPAGAPNVLLELIDDSGFGNPSTFGGPEDTPNMTRVGEQGLTYNRFDVTALLLADPRGHPDRA